MSLLLRVTDTLAADDRQNLIFVFSDISRGAHGDGALVVIDSVQRAERLTLAVDTVGQETPAVSVHSL